MEGKLAAFFMRKWRKQIEDILEPGEKILLIVNESTLGCEDKAAPATLFGTDKKMVLSRRSFFNRKFEILKYEYITHTELKHGLIYSTVNFGVQFDQKEAEQKNKWSLSGLQKSSAVTLINFVEKMRQIKREPPKREEATVKKEEREGEKSPYPHVITS